MRPGALPLLLGFPWFLGGQCAQTAPVAPQGRYDVHLGPWRDRHLLRTIRYST